MLPPRQSSSVPSVSTWLPPITPEFARRSEPLPLIVVSAPVFIRPAASSSAPLPRVVKLPAMRLPALLSDDRLNVVPSPRLMLAPLSALNVAVPDEAASRRTPLLPAVPTLPVASKCSRPPSRT